MSNKTKALLIIMNLLIETESSGVMVSIIRRWPLEKSIPNLFEKLLWERLLAWFSERQDMERNDRLEFFSIRVQTQIDHVLEYLLAL